MTEGAKKARREYYREYYANNPDAREKRNAYRREWGKRPENKEKIKKNLEKYCTVSSGIIEHSPMSDKIIKISVIFWFWNSICGIFLAYTQNAHDKNKKIKIFFII